MNLEGRVINKGSAEGEALVLDVPFSFIGDFDSDAGTLVLEGHPMQGQSVAGKILVCPTGKGGTIAPFIVYRAMQAGNAPAAILCEKADPMLCECALVMNIPIIDQFNQNPVQAIKSGKRLRIADGLVTVED
jgi:hypothetical protein